MAGFVDFLRMAMGWSSGSTAVEYPLALSLTVSIDTAESLTVDVYTNHARSVSIETAKSLTVAAGGP